MLKWLRSAGDKARLDQELQRIGAAPSALPPAVRADLVAVAQAQIDSYRAEVPPPSEFQAFFDAAFQLAAEVPTVIGAPRATAVQAIGEYNYIYIVNAIRGCDSSRRGNLIRAIYAACKRRVQNQNPDFTAALSQD
jgi:hypothetical protein